MNADGSIIIDVDLRTEEAEKEYSKLKTQIKRTTREIEDMQKKKSPLVEQAEKLNQKLKEAQAQADAFGRDWQNGVVGADRQQTEALETVQRIRAEYEAVVSKIDKIDEKLLPAVEHMERCQKEAGEMRQEIDKAAKGTAKNAKNTEKMSEATKKASKHAQTFAGRMKNLFIHTAEFGLVFQAYNALSDWLVRAIKSNDEAAAAIARFKGALLTMVQPILNVVIPAFSALVDVATKVIAVFARLIAAVFGTTVEESANAAENLYNEQNALEGVGDAAKKATKQLAAFDEINRLTGETAETNAGTSVTNPIIPDFTAIKNVKLPEWLEKIVSSLEVTIKDVRFAISDFFSGNSDGTEDGSFWGTLAKVLTVVAGASLFLGFTKNKGIGLGLGLAISLIGANFFDETTELSIVGATIIADLISSAAKKVTTAGGGTFSNGLLSLSLGLEIGILSSYFKDKMGGKSDSTLSKMLHSIVAGLLTKSILSAFGVSASLAWGAAAIAIPLTLILSFGFEYADEIHGVADSVVEGVTTIMEVAGQQTSGLVMDVFESQQNMNAIMQNGSIPGALPENPLDIDYDLFPNMGQELKGIASTAPNAAAQAAEYYRELEEELYKKATKPNLPSLPSVPRLATGAVIPPNREFMAVLGDQKSGTNIEAPLDTIVQAMQIALGNNGGGRNEAVLEVDGTVFGRLAYKYGDRERKRIGVSLAGGNA